MNDVIVLGDSHIGAFYRLKEKVGEELGVASRKVQLQWIDNGTIAYAFTVRLATESADRLNPIVELALDSAGVLNRYSNSWLKKDCPLYFILGFSETHLVGFHPSLKAHYIVGEEPPDGRRPVDRMLIVEGIQARLDTFFVGQKILTSHGYDVTVVAGPPPHRDNSFIIAKNHHLLDLPAATTRLAVYRCACDAVARGSRQAGARFAPVAQPTSDADGFLKQEFELDGIHANEAYAAAVLSELFGTPT